MPNQLIVYVDNGDNANPANNYAIGHAFVQLQGTLPDGTSVNKFYGKYLADGTVYDDAVIKTNDNERLGQRISKVYMELFFLITVICLY